MTDAGVVIFLHVPELGPSLGKLISGTPSDAGEFPLAAVRLQLVSRVFEQAGEARRLATDDQWAAGLEALGRAAWLGAWEEAVAATTDRFLGRVDRQLDAEARAVHMPARLRARLRPTDHDRRQLIARLGSTGAGLVHALDEVERTGQVLRGAVVLDQGGVTEWQEATLTAARRLEAAWLALEETLAGEVARARHVAAAVSRWRPSWWPVVLVGGAALALALWLGAILGGYLDAPGWFAWLWRQVAP